jgi:hypothetical protein
MSGTEERAKRPPPSAPVVPTIDPEVLRAASEKSAAGLGLKLASAAGEPEMATTERSPTLPRQRNLTRRAQGVGRFVKADVGPDLLRALAMQALAEGRSERELVTEALRSYLDRQGRKL